LSNYAELPREIISCVRRGGCSIDKYTSELAGLFSGKQDREALVRAIETLCILKSVLQGDEYLYVARDVFSRIDTAELVDRLKTLIHGVSESRVVHCSISVLESLAEAGYTQPVFAFIDEILLKAERMGDVSVDEALLREIINGPFEHLPTRESTILLRRIASLDDNKFLELKTDALKAASIAMGAGHMADPEYLQALASLFSSILGYLLSKPLEAVKAYSDVSTAYTYALKKCLAVNPRGKCTKVFTMVEEGIAKLGELLQDTLNQ